jgi:hypothetical protein
MLLGLPLRQDLRAVRVLIREKSLYLGLKGTLGDKLMRRPKSSVVSTFT